MDHPGAPASCWRVNLRTTRCQDNPAAATQAAKALPRLIERADSVLTDQLDKRVVQFKATGPEFVARYQPARTIVSRSVLAPTQAACL